MRNLTITVGTVALQAQFETAKAPLTCAAFMKLLPFREQIIHVRWSGEAMWVPLGERDLGVPPENATVYPLPGEILFYPGGVSEVELLIPYGRTRFASKAGELAGNHCLTIVSGIEHLADLGRLTLWHGAQPIRIESA